MLRCIFNGNAEFRRYLLNLRMSESAFYLIGRDREVLSRADPRRYYIAEAFLFKGLYQSGNTTCLGIIDNAADGFKEIGLAFFVGRQVFHQTACQIIE